MTDSEKCPSCDREVTSIIPVPEGGMTVCVGCLVVMVMESGKLRVASEQEAESQVAQRKVKMAEFLRRLCPTGDIRTTGAREHAELVAAITDRDGTGRAHPGGPRHCQAHGDFEPCPECKRIRGRKEP